MIDRQSLLVAAVLSLAVATPAARLLAEPAAAAHAADEDERPKGDARHGESHKGGREKDQDDDEGDRAKGKRGDHDKADHDDGDRHKGEGKGHHGDGEEEDDEIEQAVPLDMVPSGVLDAVKKELPGGTIEEAELVAADGNIVYTFDVKSGDTVYDLTISVAGKFISKTVDDADDADGAKEQPSPATRPAAAPK